MPNPIMRLGSPNRSKSAPDRPTPITPVIEEISEPNFPYRGIENHGVPVTGHGNYGVADAANTATVDAVFEIEPEPEHVVPVRIVRDNTDNDAREIRIMRVRQTMIGTEPQRIIGRNVNRQSIVIRPNGTANNDPAGGTLPFVTWNTGTAVQQTISTNPGRVYQIYYANNDANAHLVNVIDLASGAVVWSVWVGANSSNVFTYPNGPRFAAGVALRLDYVLTANNVVVSTQYQRDSQTVAVLAGASRESAQSLMQGYPLNDSADNTFNTQDELWLCAPNAAGAQIPVWIREEISEPA